MRRPSRSAAQYAGTLQCCSALPHPPSHLTTAPRPLCCRRRQPELQLIASPDRNQGVRSLQLSSQRQQGHLLSFGTGAGRLYFYDLRSQKFLPTELKPLGDYDDDGGADDGDDERSGAEAGGPGGSGGSRHNLVKRDLTVDLAKESAELTMADDGQGPWGRASLCREKVELKQF